jgi:predicted permease
VLLFALAASLGSGLLFGLGPLVAVWRGRFESALKTNDRTASGTVSMRARSLLVLVEIGLSVVLLIGAGLLVRTFQNLHTFNPGFDASNVLTFQLSIPSERYQGSDGVPRFTFALEQQLRAIPGVEAAGAINLLPLDEREPNFALPFWTRRTVDDESPAPLADTRLVTPGYFDTLRSELLAGRWFDETDDTNHPPAVIIDDRFARQAWPGQDPLGQELQLNVRDKTWRRVVGVIRHIRQHRLSEEVREQVFLPLAQWPRNQLSVVVRAPLPPDQLLPAISQQIASLDPHMAPARVRRLADLAAQSRAPARFSMVLGSLFAACSLLLTCLSLYGVISYSVVQRTPEFGVRAALGASRRDLLRLVLRQGLGLILAGSVVGLIGAGLVMRSLRSLLFGVTAFDPLTFVIVPIAVALTALAACYAPARRASQVDPLVALRNE